MVSFLKKFQEACAEQAKRGADPLRENVETIVRGMEAISTFALLDLLCLPKTTGNGRRLARTMRSLGYVPIKSRRLMPGGYRDTVTRGWARPVRANSQPLISPTMTLRPNSARVEEPRRKYISCPNAAPLFDCGHLADRQVGEM
jgi:hypothetical protein